MFVEIKSIRQYIESHVGCYETGSLDFFGPLCVVACYVDKYCS